MPNVSVWSIKVVRRHTSDGTPFTVPLSPTEDHKKFFLTPTTINWYKVEQMEFSYPTARQLFFALLHRIVFDIVEALC